MQVQLLVAQEINIEGSKDANIYLKKPCFKIDQNLKHSRTEIEMTTNPNKFQENKISYQQSFIKKKKN